VAQAIKSVLKPESAVDPALAGDRDLPLRVVERQAPAAAGGLPALRPGERSGRRRRRWLYLLPLVPLIALTGAVVGLYVQPPGVRIAMDLLGLEPGAAARNPIAVPPARNVHAGAAPARAAVLALGALVPESEVITVAPPFGAGDARIAAIEAHEGQRVAAGELLALLDSRDELDAAVAIAQAQVGVLEATLVERRAAIAASRDEAAAALGRAEATAENARREMERGEALVAKGALSRSVAEDRRASYAEAEREVARARATLSRYDATDLDRQPDVVVAARNLDAARAELARAQRQAQAARIRAPISGTVLSIHARPGERPGERGILTLGNIERMTVKAEVYQTEIGAIEIGQPVTITAEALPRPLAGTVSEIGLEIGRQQLVGDDPAANTDARVIEVTVALDEASSAVAARFTNLQVTAAIDTSGGASTTVEAPEDVGR
jgi:HlyD family secretion protein